MNSISRYTLRKYRIIIQIKIHIISLRKHSQTFRKCIFIGDKTFYEIDTFKWKEFFIWYIIYIWTTKRKTCSISKQSNLNTEICCNIKSIFFHIGIPDIITHCLVDTSSNITITIRCKKSYAQGDDDGYTCILFKYNNQLHKKLFEEIARTKSCIFALENSHEPIEYRISALNRFGSLSPNTHGYIIRLNQSACK